MIELLPLQSQYCEVVAKIAKESLPEYWSLEGIRDVLRYDNNIYYVACDLAVSDYEEYSEKKVSGNRLELEKEKTDLSGKVIGFAGIMLVADEAELLNIAVTGTFRGRGIGQKLLTKMLSEASRRGVQRMLLEVRKSNEPAINLYHKNGFVELGERKNYYSNPEEDAVIMERKL